MQSIRFIFLSRAWSSDEKLIREGMSWFSETEFPLQLLLFPEGTDLSPSNKEKGHNYAAKNDLPKYDYVLHPRMKGFCLCIEELRKFKTPPTLVNISVGYVGAMPQNERHIAAGIWPTEIHFHAKQEPLASLPSDEEGLSQWLKKCWQEKEKELKNFYSQKKFSAPYLSDARFTKSVDEMKKMILLWTIFLLYIGYNCLTNSFYWYYFPIFTTFYMTLGYVTGGVDKIFIKRSKLFSRRN
jgi:lysocardiolipin and lysophospholipid acyltransferase